MAQQDGSPQVGLPVDIIDHSGAATAPHGAPHGGVPGYVRRIPLLLLIPGLLFTGAVIGLYVQPPGVQKFFELVGLEPGGGSSTPFALPPDLELPQDMLETLQISDVVGLTRLEPIGGISPVAAPSGAGDARISEILVSVGDVVEKGQLVARLDNLAHLQSAVQKAQANVAVREATLLQTRDSVRNSLDEARAALEQAKAVAEVASSDRERAQELFERKVATQAALNAALSIDRQAGRAVEIAHAKLMRYTSDDIDTQPDVIVAARNLEAAQIDLTRARLDLGQARVVAPIAGVVLDIDAHAGERPPLTGIMQVGDTRQMMARVEIYQDRISLVKTGQPVEIVSEAITQTLTGTVEQVGLLVGRQDLVSTDTAAGIDARVFEILVRLDQGSSQAAAGYTNLEAVARVDTRAVTEADK